MMNISGYSKKIDLLRKFKSGTSNQSDPDVEKTITPIEPKNNSSPHSGGGFRWGGKVQDVHPHPSLPPS
jgi:hypothetical protein